MSRGRRRALLKSECRGALARSAVRQVKDGYASCSRRSEFRWKVRSRGDEQRSRSERAVDVLPMRGGGRPPSPAFWRGAAGAQLRQAPAGPHWPNPLCQSPNSKTGLMTGSHAGTNEPSYISCALVRRTAPFGGLGGLSRPGRGTITNRVREQNGHPHRKEPSPGARVGFRRAALRGTVRPLLAKASAR